ncbi:MAG: hypothetical protein JWN34_4881, partial [Bryobacterales bacterium]|nr:hypothetical protein [Bryobacterales bacterium]
CFQDVRGEEMANHKPARIPIGSKEQIGSHLSIVEVEKTVLTRKHPARQHEEAHERQESERSHPERVCTEYRGWCSSGNGLLRARGTPRRNRGQQVSRPIPTGSVEHLKGMTDVPTGTSRSHAPEQSGVPWQGAPVEMCASRPATAAVPASFDDFRCGAMSGPDILCVGGG